ncbi:MAG: PIN domain-containing protein, partial [Pseudobdellovibrionaceae bacterium]
MAGSTATPVKNKRRKVVLDTNVILFDALAVMKFKEADIHIPISVIEEIDRFKRDPGENGRNARQFSRFVDLLREKGSLAEGVQLDNSESIIHINTDYSVSGLPAEFDTEKADNRILGTAIFLQKQFPRIKVELITKDINLRIKADVLGVTATDYEPDGLSDQEMYEGYQELEVTAGDIDRFF